MLKSYQLFDRQETPPLTGQYLPEKARQLAEAAKLVGLGCQVLQPGANIETTPRRYLPVDQGYNGVVIFRQQPQDAELFWQAVNSLDQASEEKK